MRDNAAEVRGYILDVELIRWYAQRFLANSAQLDDLHVFPLASDDLSRLPSSLVITAEFDPLRDEGVVLGERLRGAGVTVEHHHAADQMHGFLLLARAVPRARELIDLIAIRLAKT